MWFYGVIQEIWVLDYTKFMVPIFKCDWVADSGIKVDELGFTLVNLSKVGHKRDQFVVAVLLIKPNKYFMLKILWILDGLF